MKTDHARQLILRQKRFSRFLGRLVSHLIGQDVPDMHFMIANVVQRPTQHVRGLPRKAWERTRSRSIL
jgi:hypothetical protein